MGRSSRRSSVVAPLKYISLVMHHSLGVVRLGSPRALHRRHHPREPLVGGPLLSLEVEVTSQGETLEEARTNLAEALALYFEDEAGDLGVGEAPIIAPVDVDVGG